MKPSLLMLLISAAIGTLGASLFWTGFPVYFASLSKTSWNLSGVYSFATFGTLLFTLLGGILSDKGNYQKLAIRSHFMSFVFILMIFSLAMAGQANLVLIFLPFLYFNFSLGIISESVWLLKNSEEADYKNTIVSRTMLTIGSKLIGFSLGPWIFLNFEKYSFLICASAFLFTALVQTILAKRFIPYKESIASKSQGLNLPKLFSKPKFVMTAFLTGMLSIPLNPLVVQLLKEGGTKEDISYFWFFAGLAGVFATLLMKKTKILDQKGLFSFFTFCMCCFVYFVFNNTSAVVIISFAALYVFCSIHFSAKTQLLALQKSNQNTLGSSLGSVNFLVDLGVFTGMVLGSGLSTVSYQLVAYFIIGLLVLRWLAFEKFHLYQNQIFGHS